MQELAGQDVDAVVQGCREQQPLAVGGGGLHDAGHAGQKAQVGHVVGLVEDGDLHLVEPDDALAHQVFETAGARDDDVHAAPERLHLTALLDAAEHGGDDEVLGLRQRADGGGDLGGQFAGGGQDQTGRRAGGAANPAFGLGLGQSGDDGDRECEGLAGAGLAAAEHVAAGEGVGQGGHLDLEGFCLPFCGKYFHKTCGHAEGFECRGQSMCFHYLDTPTTPGSERRMSMGEHAGLRARSPYESLVAG